MMVGSSFLMWCQNFSKSILIYSGVSVSWQMSEYIASEGSVISVCAVQPAPTERAFSVEIIAPFTEGMMIQ